MKIFNKKSCSNTGKNKNGVLFSLILLSSVIFASACGKKTETNQDRSFNKGIEALESGDYEGAIKNFDKAMEYAGMTVCDEEKDISYYKAAAQHLSGDTAGAIDTVTNVLGLDSKESELYFLRGSYYILLQDYKKGVKDYKKAAELSPKDYEMQFKIYDNLIANGQDEKAASFLDKILDKAGKDGEGHLAKGRVYLLKSDFENADAEFKQAAASGNNQAYLWSAKLKNAEGNPKDAISEVKKYADREKASAESYNAIAEADMALKDYEDALKNIKKGLKEESVPNRQILERNRIICLEYLGEFEEARKYGEKYIGEYPLDTEMLEEWKFLSTR